MPDFKLTRRLFLPTLIAPTTMPGTVTHARTRTAAPPPPAPGGVEITTVAPGDLTKIILFSVAYQATGAYDRFQHMSGVVLSGASASIGFRAWNFGGGGTTPRPLGQSTYTLLVDGAPMATASIGKSAQAGAFVLDLGRVSEGWHIFSIEGDASGETAIPHGFYVLKSAAYVKQAWIPVITNTYEFTQQNPSSGIYNTGLSHPVFHVVKVPGVLNRRSVPLDKRLMHDRDAFSAKLNNNDLVAYHLAPVKFGDRHNPTLGRHGVLNAYARQDYFWEDFLTKRPLLSLLDGPRGVGTMKFPTSLKFSKRPDGRKIYFTDGWRFGVISEDGHIRTLAGWRHKDPPPHWENPGVGGRSDTVWGPNTEAQLELVGDWSSMPVARQGFYEPWGMDFADPTLIVNESVPPIDAGTDPMEPPHAMGPVAFVADTHHNRVVKVVFKADARTPGVCTEFITGLKDPWDLVHDAGKLYISERTGHRISVYSAVTPNTFIENLVSNPVSMSGVDASRFTFLTGGHTRAQVQAADVVGPEGLDLVNGWLYYGSSAMRCIKRINLKTREKQFWLQLDKGIAKATKGFSDAQVYFFPWPDDNSHFLNFSISDGTFGPEGTAAIATWSVSYYGLPVLMQPDNLHWDTTPGTATAGQGPVGVGYVSATAIKNGMMVYGGATEGLCFMAKRGTQDLSLANLGGDARVGRQNYLAAGYHLAYGLGGYGYFDTGLPWDVNGNINAFLRSNLHVRIPKWRRNKAVHEWFALPASSITGDADGRLAFSGMALQSTQIAETLWLGPGGGHNDNADNSVRSVDLLADAPAVTLRMAATPVAQRTQNTAYYADGRPAARHLYSSMHFVKRLNKLMCIGTYVSHGDGNFNAPKVAGFNPATNTWDPAGTHPDAAVKNGCMDSRGDVWGIGHGADFASAINRWDRNTRTQAMLVDFGSGAGGPLAFDSRREQFFSLSWGNGEDKYGSGVRAFAYRSLYSVTVDGPGTPTRTAITLNSIGGALERFKLDRTEYGGMDYDPGLDVFLFYDGRNVDGIDRRGRVYVIRPTSGTTWDISILPLGSGTGTPPHTKGAGVNNRFRYVPKLKGFVLYADGSQPLWFLPTESIAA